MRELGRGAGLEGVVGGWGGYWGVRVGVHVVFGVVVRCPEG